jgi:PKD repeat protein
MLIAALAVAARSGTAMADFAGEFQSKYPSSTSISADCQVCHGNSTSRLNGYGRALQDALRQGAADIFAAFAVVEALNSDGNAGSNTNIAEINAGAQPGWTTGLNTTYPRSRTGATAQETAPAGLLLDPAANVAPTAKAGGPYGGTAGSAVTFNGSGVDPDGSIVSYSWNFGDGSAAGAGAAPTHAYAAAGTYTVTLTVTDNGTPALTGSATATATIVAANQPPVVANPGSQSSTVGNPVSLQIVASDPEKGILTYGATGLPAGLSIHNTSGLISGTATTARASSAATVTVTDNGTPSKSTSVTFSWAVQAAPVPNIVVSPLSIDFGNVTEKTNSDRKVNIANTGQAALTIGAFLDSPNSLDFSIVTGPPATLAPSQQTDVVVRYTPDAVGADAGALAINSNDPDMPQITVPLSGSGVAAPVPVCVINVGPASVDFGTLNLSDSATKQVTISNNGTANCTVAASLDPATSPDFAVSSPGSFTLTPSTAMAVELTYIASNPGSDAGTLDITSDDPNKPNVAVGLKGAGPAAQNIVVSPLAVNFGNVTQSTNSDRKVNVANTGQVALTVSASLDGTSPDFSIVTGPPATIAAGQSADVTVRYTPDAVAPDADTLVINSNDPDMPQITVGLSGAGVAAPALTCMINVGPASVDFGTLDLYGSATKQVTVSNNGTANCSVSAALDPATSPDFSALSANNFTLAPGKSQTLNVSYRCSGAGSDAGALNIASNDPNKPKVTVGLKGAGAQAALVVKQLEIEAKWQAKTSRLIVQGEVELARHADRSAVTVTITNRNTGALLGTVTSNQEGKWRLVKVIRDRTLVPCGVSADAGGLNATEKVEDAPKSCRSGGGSHDRSHSESGDRSHRRGE